MKLKKLCSAILSGVMALSLMNVLPLSNSSKGNGTSSERMETVSAASNLRRPCSPEQPMLIVHIDTWNVADPAKLIASIPEDIRPYCVFNVSLSIYWDKNNNRWGLVQDGYECAKSWLRTCSDEGVWCMVQPASGGQCHFPDYNSSGNIINFPSKNNFVSHADDDYENTIYAEFFRDYPGFLGFNYSEQFWGFDQGSFPVTPVQRYEHFAKLLKLCNKYGGYLNVNWCANQWSAPLNPIAMLKCVPSWREACEKYSQNLQIEEKYTQGSFISDVESEVLGMYLGGWCGNFGVRYDETGWTDCNDSGQVQFSKNYYRQTTGMPIHMERMMLNGATIIDGPELVWQDDFREIGYNDSEGYRCRGWETKDIYVDSTLAFFRKVIDGTIRIPSREEVINRTKYVVIQDNNSGDDHNKYSTYPTLFEGLYRMPGDGNLRNNNNLYKCTGRYPTIPTVYGLRDDLAKKFQFQLKQSQLGSRWSSISAKQDELNKVFPAQYSGTCYVANYENAWVTYNPNKTGKNCGGVFDLKYNTCKSMDVNFNAFGNALIHEFSDHINIHTNNFDNKAQTTLKTDTFKINGCAQKPTYTAKDTGRNQAKSQITESYSNGTYTLTVKHNGPVDITVNCKGNESGRQTVTKKSAVQKIASPPAYTGVRQYEGEFFDLKNCEGYVGNACGSGVNNVQGQGFLKFGNKGNAMAKDTVSTEKAGEFNLKLRYSSTADINNVDLYVNNSKVTTLKLSNTNGYSNWKTVEQKISLKQGDNRVEFKANAGLPSSLYIDNFTVSGNFGSTGGQQTPQITTPPETTPVVTTQPAPISGALINNLKVNDTVNAGKWSITGNFGKGSVLFGDRDFTCTELPSVLNGAEAIKTACDSKLVLTDLATFTAATDMTVCVCVDSRIASQLPSWLKDWKKTGLKISTSNELTFDIYSKSYKSGSTVTLGTNGGSNECVNYIVLATKNEVAEVTTAAVTSAPVQTTVTEKPVTTVTKPQNEILYGDVDENGSIEVTDLTYLSLYLLGDYKLTENGIKAADVNGDGVCGNLADLAHLKQYISLDPVILGPKK